MSVTIEKKNPQRPNQRQVQVGRDMQQRDSREGKMLQVQQVWQHVQGQLQGGPSQDGEAGGVGGEQQGLGHYRITRTLDTHQPVL